VLHSNSMAAYRIRPMFALCLALALACGSEPESASEAGAPTADAAVASDGRSPDGGVRQPEVELNLLYVHGVKSCEVSRLNAHFSLKTLDDEVLGETEQRIADYKKTHPNLNVVVRSHRANLYSAKASPTHPSDSKGPESMDDWEVGDPGCSTRAQGDACTTAFEWRYRLAQEIQQAFPPNAKNIVLIGHSTGARTAFEVAANVGAGGAVGSYDWGVQKRIAGVVSLHGMVDAIGSNTYDVAGPLSFTTLCKNSDAVVGFGDSCANGNGWCEYAADVSATAAADWVATNKRALMLISSGSCSPSLWSGVSDGSLPIDAQGSPRAVGVELAPLGNGSFRPAHGVRYGSFCHSSIDSITKGDHMAAVTAAKERILDFLFKAAPRTIAAGELEIASLGKNESSGPRALGTTCEPGFESDTLSPAPANGSGATGVDIAAVCKHPGFSDGDSHSIDKAELAVSGAPDCKGSVNWTQTHDDNRHAATVYWKVRGLAQGAPALLDGLPRTNP
jgi:hypothetical protein